MANTTQGTNRDPISGAPGSHPVGVGVGGAGGALAGAAVGSLLGPIGTLLGGAVGTVAGVFTGLWGLVFMPLVGAAVGEFIAHKDALRAGKVGAATWFGLLVATAIKIAVAFTMIGVFVAAILF